MYNIMFLYKQVVYCSNGGQRPDHIMWFSWLLLTENQLLMLASLIHSSGENPITVATDWCV